MSATVVESIFAECRRAGITLRLKGDGIAITPASALTAELRVRVMAHRPALVAALKSKMPGRGTDKTDGRLVARANLPQEAADTTDRSAKRDLASVLSVGGMGVSAPASPTEATSDLIMVIRWGGPEPASASVLEAHDWAARPVIAGESLAREAPTVLVAERPPFAASAPIGPDPYQDELGRPLRPCWLNGHRRFVKVEGGASWICFGCQQPMSPVVDEWIVLEPGLRGMQP